MELEELLALVVRQGASDLHLSAGMPPLLRIDGDLRRVNTPELDDRTVQGLVQGIMSERQRRTYEEELELDFAVELSGLGRFRVNAFQQNRGAGASFRHIPGTILDLEQLGAPGVLRELAALRTGLVLVTGPTGSGKSTTLAAMVDHKNRNEAGHILTIEDPIEFVHASRRGLVNQREIHRDTNHFGTALRSALREDPDTILVGELRDLETIRLALTAAETGHLVFGTLHTSSAAKTVDRIIDVFPAAEKDMIRSMLAESLRGVIAQVLLKASGGGRVAAHEILVGTSAVRNLIREDKVAQLYSTMQTGHNAGMSTLDQSLQDLVARGSVSLEEARRFAFHRESVQ
ncbi:MAG: type IV pilus twitching motility protein PilT [Pseudomonadota bacterium]